jgi:hypothetical protein
MTEAEVSKEIKRTLEVLKCCGDVIWYCRLNSGKVHDSRSGAWIQLCEKGTPDFICIIWNKAKSLSVIFIEAKHSNGGKWEDEQREFCNKYCKGDIYYFLIKDPTILQKKIMDIAYDRLNDITWEED